eukprot:scaffold147031_cov25-Tisochrysis_lutea.AAC.2
MFILHLNCNNNCNNSAGPHLVAAHDSMDLHVQPRWGPEENFLGCEIEAFDPTTGEILGVAVPLEQ